MSSIYLIRHGQASFGKANYDKLSELGIKQAQVLGEGFAKRKVNFDKVVHGGLVRHQETANHFMMSNCGEQAQHLYHVDPRFREYDHQEVVAKHHPAFKDHYSMAAYLSQQDNPRKVFQQVFEGAISRWRSGDFDQDYSESWEAFLQRCHDGIESLVDESDLQIAVFTSGGPISAIMQKVLQLTDDQTIQLSWSIVNASVTKIKCRDKHLSLSFFNDYGYFESVDSELITYR